MLLILSLLLVALQAPDVGAQATYPTKPIRLVFNQGAGSTGDTATRVMASALERQLGVPVAVVNIVEAGGIAGVNEVYRAQPDGYTLLSAFFPRTVQQEVLLNPLYKTRELTPIYGFRRGAFVLAVGHDSPFTDFVTLVEASKHAPITVGVTGIGSATHLQLVRLADVTGARMEIIPFSGGAAAEAAAIGGHIDAVITPADSALAKLDVLRVLITPTDTRLNELPDVPALRDLGYPGADVSFYQALMGPPNLPDHIRLRLEEAVKNVLQDPEFLQQWNALSFEAYPMEADEIRELVENLYVIVDEYKDQLQ